MSSYKFGKIAVARRNKTDGSLTIVKDDFEENSKALAEKFIQDVEVTTSDVHEFQILRIYPEVYAVETELVEQRAVNVVGSVPVEDVDGVEPEEDDYLHAGDDEEVGDIAGT